ncbi:SpoIIE family protein phosphatase [Maridesulfovibrio sp.]|uniref:SpoIIE family protein phosphatase n=1 Tax=Maridesulfovibrio sp. TaxID=2795000 RepID=UPI002A18B323|nr:SpoIIE family protein phosphatase [Maridesulfovibrio sp.]
MFKAVVGQAEGTDTSRTVACVLSRCKEQLDGLKPSAGIIFSADHFDHAVTVREILNAFPGLQLTGCTTDGEMSSAHGFSQDSICLILFASDTISMSAGYSAEISGRHKEAISEILAEALPGLDGPPAGCIVFVETRQMVKGFCMKELRSALGPECVITGGMAGTDVLSPCGPKLFHSSGPSEHGMSILLFSGPLRMETTICNSWDPVGYKGTVDSADGNIINRIAGRPALEFFRDAFGPYARPLPEMPLALFDENGRYHLRSTRDFDESDGSITTAIAIPEGSTIRLTEATPSRLLSNLREKVDELYRSIEGHWAPQAALLFSCTSRRWILGMRTKEELVQAQEVLPENIPVSGFYTYGEIAALSKGHNPRLHNCTLVALLMGEENNTATDFCPHKRKRTCSTPAEQQELMETKLRRAVESQHRLEMQKESFTHVLKRTSADLAAANSKIKKHNLIMKESLTMAQEVQQSLLPNYSPLLAGFEIVGRSISCDETGGDYLDYLRDETGLSVVVGDVAGHGVAAALVMTTARALLRMREYMGGSPQELIEDLNRLLTGDVRISGRFMTLFYLHINPADRMLTWIRAGHEPALIYSPEKDEFTELVGEGMALGVMEEFEYSQRRTGPLDPGDIVFMNTDGITEARNPSGELYGRERLKDFIRRNAGMSGPELLEACFEEIKNYQQGRTPEDDETLVVIKVKRTETSS